MRDPSEIQTLALRNFGRGRVEFVSHARVSPGPAARDIWVGWGQD